MSGCLRMAGAKRGSQRDTSILDILGSYYVHYLDGNDPFKAYAYGQTYQIEYSTYVQCIVFQLFSNKAANFFFF